MSHGRSTEDGLAYGDIPQRWDRDRFERMASRPPVRREEDFHFTERDRPGRRDVTVIERSRSRGPRGRFEERDVIYETERETQRPRRRTDRELFGELDPRELAEVALTPYRRGSITREEIDVTRRESRPGVSRRQSSLDSFDRRPLRYEVDEYRIQPYTSRRRRDEFEDSRYEPEDYREVEIRRERSIHRRHPPRSEASQSIKEEVKSVHREEESSSSSSSTTVEEIKERKSVHAGSSRASTRASTKARSSRAPSVHESIHESSVNESISGPSIHESIHQSSFEESVRAERRFKKGKTRMPKRLVRREAIMDLGYPFMEEENFLVLQIALDKEQIDEVIRVSETYKDGEKRKVYHFDAKVEEESEYSVPPPPIGEETITRTEWINPPTVIGSHPKSLRSSSPTAKSSISRRLSPPRTEHSRRSRSRGTFVEQEEKTTIEIRSPSRAPRAPSVPRGEFYEERDVVIEDVVPSRKHHHGTLVLAERDHRSDRDIKNEIFALEAERRALRSEREKEERHDLALRVRDDRHNDLEIVEFHGRPTEVVGIYERERADSEERNVVRVEKDRKARTNQRLVAAALATLS